MSDEGREPIVESDNAEPPGDFHGGALAALFGMPSPERRELELRAIEIKLKTAEMANQRAAVANGVLAGAAVMVMIAMILATVFGVTWAVHAIAQLKW